MLKIRLQRIGKKKQAHFRVVVQEHSLTPGGKYLESLGYWNPHQDIFHFDKDRAEHWLKQGAQVSDTVRNLMLKHSVIKN